MRRFVAMTDMICGECGTPYSMPTSLYDECVKRGPDKTFYCPNGHPRIFKESAADKMRRERDRAIQEQARLAEEARLERERREKAERALKQHKKRSAAGACPCCQRTFSNMAEHMKRQHPEYVAQSGAKVVPLKRAG